MAATSAAALRVSASAALASVSTRAMRRGRVEPAIGGEALPVAPLQMLAAVLPAIFCAMLRVTCSHASAHITS